MKRMKKTVIKSMKKMRIMRIMEMAKVMKMKLRRNQFGCVRCAKDGI